MKAKLKHTLKKWIKGDLRDRFWNVYGKSIRNPKCSDDPKSFLFVCKGNICRSPFAEYLARKLAVNGGAGERSFFSAGLEVSQPSPPAEEAVLVAESFGIQLDGHRARRIEREMMESFGMIIAMETWQFQTLKKLFPDYQNKIFLLTLFDTDETLKGEGFSRYNIHDPYGQSVEEFHRCFHRVKSCVEGLLTQLTQSVYAEDIEQKALGKEHGERIS